MKEPSNRLLRAVIAAAFVASGMGQINGYGAFFDSSVGTNISLIFFDSAQKEGLCRAYSKAVLPYCTSFQ